MKLQTVQWTTYDSALSGPNSFILLGKYMPLELVEADDPFKFINPILSKF